MSSSALHFKSKVAAVVPDAGLFVLSISGISPNRGEDTNPNHSSAGLAALSRVLPGIAMV